MPPPYGSLFTRVRARWLVRDDLGERRQGGHPLPRRRVDQGGDATQQRAHHPLRMSTTRAGPPRFRVRSWSDHAGPLPSTQAELRSTLEALMTTSSTSGTHPGLMVGPTSEFSLFFRVKPGASAALRGALETLQNTPGYRPGDYGITIQTIHEARFVLFDDDTQLAFITTFDGAWDVYMEDFFTSGPTLA